MNVPLVSGSPDLVLRTYARSSSVVINVTLGTSFVLFISFESLAGLYWLIEKAVTGFGRLPSWAQWTIALAAFALLAHPKSRQKLIDAWGWVWATVKGWGPGLVTVLGEVGEQYSAAQKTATRTYAEIQSALPKAGRRTAIQHARSICLLSNEPLSLPELEQRMRKEGYSTKARNFALYLRRVLQTQIILRINSALPS